MSGVTQGRRQGAEVNEEHMKAAVYISPDASECGFCSQGRIKKIMQKDTEVGRIAMAVPVIISRALEIFLKSLLTKICVITRGELSAVVSVSHMKQCIESEEHFHFLRDRAEQAAAKASQKDKRGMSMWPMY
ncbi:hypothetical protein FQN60_012671, partial [Etheostoma spectabile]